MRAGNLISRVSFYAKVTTRDAFGASADTWPSVTLSTRGELRWVGGSRSLSNEEQFFSRNMELTVRYRSTIVETMRVRIDGTNDLYAITYIEIIGRKEGLRLTLEKLSDGLSSTLVQPPTNFTATLDAEVKIDLSWTNNADKDGVIIERSTNGNDFTVIAQIAKATPEVTTYSDEGLAEFTRYYYRARAFKYYNYSAYTAVDDATTEEVL